MFVLVCAIHGKEGSCHKAYTELCQVALARFAEACALLSSGSQHRVPSLGAGLVSGQKTPSL